MAAVAIARGQGPVLEQLDAHLAEAGEAVADFAEVDFLPVLDPAPAFAVAAPGEGREEVVELLDLGAHFRRVCVEDVIDAFRVAAAVE